MKSFLANLVIFLLFFSFSLLAQHSIDLRLEPGNLEPRTKNGWRTFGQGPYTAALDSVVRHKGRYSYRIQPNGKTAEGNFFATNFTIPAKYAGKQVELEGYVKTENVIGWAGLWLRIDGNNTALQFDNMEKRGIKGTTDWTKYTVKLPLPAEAEQIQIGGILSGTGTAWYADLNVFINGDELVKAKPRVDNPSRAKTDTTFIRGSGITINNLTPRQSDNLAVLGRVWGFLKYHHPAIADGQYNWDAELFRVMPQVLKAQTVDERSAVFLNWIQRLGPIKTGGTRTDTTTVKKAFLKPDLQLFSDSKVFSKALIQQFNTIYQNRNDGTHYYIGMVPQVGNPIIKNEEAYAKMTSPDAGYRLLCLYRYWNLVNYFFPYRNLFEENWNDVLTASVPKFVNAHDSLQYRLATLELIGRIHDTHANIWSNDKTLNAWRGAYYSPVQVKFIENQAVVTGYYADSAGRASGLKPGDVITKIDGVPVSDLIKQWEPYYPASNQSARLRDMSRSLLRGQTELVKLDATRDGVPLAADLKRYSAGAIRLNTASDWASYPQDTSFRMLKDSIGYLFLGKIKNNHLETLRKALGNARGLVIDLRCYPSEFVVFTIGSFLHTAPTPFVKFTAGDVSNPGLFTWGEELKVGTRGRDSFQGKTVILINEMTQSQAEYTTMAFRAAPNVTVIGSQTAGADGNVSPFMLPGGLNTMFSGIGVYYPDGRETQRIGMVPDIEVKPTIQGIKEGRDELLERAVQLIEGQAQANR